MITENRHLVVVAAVALLSCGEQSRKAQPQPGLDAAPPTRARARAPAPSRTRRRVVNKPVIDASAHGRLLKASVVGGLGAETVRRVIRLRFKDPNGCFLEGLSRNPRLEGTVQLRFSILTSGKVSGLTLRSTLLDAKVNQCIASRVAKWRFPRTKRGPTRVVYALPYHPCHHGPVHDALILPWLEGGKQGPPPKVPRCGSAESERLFDEIYRAAKRDSVDAGVSPK